MPLISDEYEYMSAQGHILSHVTSLNNWPGVENNIVSLEHSCTHLFPPCFWLFLVEVKLTSHCFQISGVQCNESVFVYTAKWSTQQVRLTSVSCTLTHFFFLVMRTFKSHSAASVSGQFCSLMTQLSRCDTDCVTHTAQNIYYWTFYNKSLLTPVEHLENTEKYKEGKMIPNLSTQKWRLLRFSVCT